MNNDSEFNEILEFTAEKDYKRLDACLADITGKSRSFFSSIFNDKLVILNGKEATKSTKVKIGDEIEVKIPEEEVLSLEPENIHLNIIYDCKDFAVINKQKGLTVHPAPGALSGTLVNALAYHFNINDENDCRPGIVHRLDKDTTGLIIVAKHRDAREKLSKLFHDREIDKRYLAVCLGNPKFDHTIIEEPIGRSKRDRKLMTVAEYGKNAKTEVWVKERFKDTFLAEIKIHTGRTHQIRVHMKHIHMPLLGDEIYGGKRVMGKGFETQALHSWKLSFVSPFTNEKHEFEAEPPEEFPL